MEMGMGESQYRQWWLSHRCRMRKTTGVRLKLIEFAPDMKRDGVGDGDSDYNLTWLDHGRRCFLFMLEMFSSINYAYMIWEERKPCRKTGTLNLFLFVRNALGTTPQKRVSRTAVSAKSSFPFLFTLLPHPAAIVARYAVRWVFRQSHEFSFIFMISITLYMYIFASQDFSFCFGNVGTQRLPSRLLGLETAQTTHAGSADRRKGRQIYQSESLPHVGVRVQDAYH